MGNIPNISFESTEFARDFQFLPLSDLFLRIPKIKDHNPNQPHRINFFALLIVTKGSGTHQIDLKDYMLEEGTVLRIAKGQIHAFQKNPSYHGFLVIFTEDFVINHFSKSSINIISHLYNYHITSPVFNDKKGNDVLLNALFTELNSENRYAQQNIVAALLNLYLLRLERISSKTSLETSNLKDYPLFIQFKNLVETSYTETRNVKDYAQMMLISSKTLNQVVKGVTLNTAKIFIDYYVMLEIKRVIVTTSKSFKEIAFETGFGEVTNFTKFFKKNMGISPKEFRNKHF